MIADPSAHRAPSGAEQARAWAEGADVPAAGSVGSVGRGTGGPATVLVVEHDPRVADLARLYLAREGYRVHLVTDPASATDVARELRPDAVVLDLSIGAHREVAEAAAPAAIVHVVPHGGAATGRFTVLRPFSPRVLVAEVGRALRGHAPDAIPDDVLRAGAVVLDLAGRIVTVGGVRKALTAIEFDLLAFLVGRAGRVFSRDQLLAAVWGSSESAGARTVDVHIAQLRAKLGARSPLRTVRGVGYVADP